MFQIRSIECPSCREDVRYPLTSDEDVLYAVQAHAAYTEDVLTFELYARPVACDVDKLLALATEAGHYSPEDED